MLRTKVRVLLRTQRRKIRPSQLKPRNLMRLLPLTHTHTHSAGLTSVSSQAQHIKPPLKEIHPPFAIDPPTHVRSPKSLIFVAPPPTNKPLSSTNPPNVPYTTSMSAFASPASRRTAALPVSEEPRGCPTPRCLRPTHCPIHPQTPKDSGSAVKCPHSEAELDPRPAPAADGSDPTPPTPTTASHPKRRPS